MPPTDKSIPRSLLYPYLQQFVGILVIVSVCVCVCVCARNEEDGEERGHVRKVTVRSRMSNSAGLIEMSHGARCDEEAIAREIYVL